MTTIDTSTEAVERLLDGVTPGPWTEHDAGKHPHVFVCGPDELYYNGEVKDKPLVAYVTGVGAIENRAFITAARDLIPALLKERDEARAQLAEVREERAFTVSDGQRMLRKQDILTVCDDPDLCFEHDNSVARCGPCATKLAERAGIALNQYTVSNPEALRLRSELDRAEAALAAANARADLAEAALAAQIEADARIADDYTPEKHSGMTLQAHVTGRNIASAIRSQPHSRAALAASQPASVTPADAMKVQDEQFTDHIEVALDPVGAWNLIAAQRAALAASQTADPVTNAGCRQQVKVKPLDLSNLLKHAFIAGRISAGASSSFHGHAWSEYDPSESAAYARIRSALTVQPPSDVAAQFDNADWYWRTMDPDDCGDSPEEAVNRGMLGRFCVCEIASSYAGPTRYGFIAPVLDPESDDEEFVHFDTHEDAIDAAKARAALARVKGGEA